MKSSVSCIQCALANFFSCTDKFKVEPAQVKEFLVYLAGLDYNVTPVELLKATHLKTMEFIKSNDPYAAEKKMYNQKMMDQYSNLAGEIKKSADPLRTAVKLAIGGNIIDFLPKDNKNIDDKIEGILTQKLAIDQVRTLIEDLRKAKTVLYLTDNTGEIVLDKLLIETLLSHKIIQRNVLTVAARGYPIVNDATLEDAEEIGLTNLVKVINNGDNAPGTVLGSCSQKFREYFKQADVIIAKGMGNFETLHEHPEKNIYFLFVAKCHYVAEMLGIRLNDFVCTRPVIS